MQLQGSLLDYIPGATFVEVGWLGPGSGAAQCGGAGSCGNPQQLQLYTAAAATLTYSSSISSAAAGARLYVRSTHCNTQKSQHTFTLACIHRPTEAQRRRRRRRARRAGRASPMLRRCAPVCIQTLHKRSWLMYTYVWVHVCMRACAQVHADGRAPCLIAQDPAPHPQLCRAQ